MPEKEAVPVVVKFVKLPVDGVVAPIAVALMPVEVVLKFEEVNVSELEPASIVELFKPVRLRVPEVAVKLRAPPERVNPFEAVRSPAEVIAPVPVVVMFPGVVTPPVRVDNPSTVRVPAAWMFPAFEIVTPVEAYPPPIS